MDRYGRCVIDLGDVPTARVAYELEVIAGPSLEAVLQGVINRA